MAGYTHVVSYYKNHKTFGWVFCDFRTTADAVKLHMKSLAKQEKEGTVRNVQVVKL